MALTRWLRRWWLPFPFLQACGGRLPDGDIAASPPVVDAALDARANGAAESAIAHDAGPREGDSAAESGTLESGVHDDIGWAKPLGIFPGVIDQWVMAAAHDVNAQCCIFSGDDLDSCRGEELGNDLGDLARLACIAHWATQSPAVATWVAQIEQLLERRAACFRQTVCVSSDISSAGVCTSNIRIPYDQAPPELMACPTGAGRTCFDPSGVPRSASACDGHPECLDDGDELNCPESREGFRCSATEMVPWSAVCDGREDCGNKADEVICSAL